MPTVKNQFYYDALDLGFLIVFQFRLASFEGPAIVKSPALPWDTCYAHMILSDTLLIDPPPVPTVRFVQQSFQVGDYFALQYTPTISQYPYHAVVQAGLLTGNKMISGRGEIIPEIAPPRKVPPGFTSKALHPKLKKLQFSGTFHKLLFGILNPPFKVEITFQSLHIISHTPRTKVIQPFETRTYFSFPDPTCYPLFLP